MKPLRRDVPSLGALTVFEAASRLLSFTDAASELGVTQAAVSRRIKELEADLGCQLFVRANRGIRLTLAGHTLADATSRSFHLLSHAVSTIRELNDGKTLSIGASLAFAHFRLLPALAAFRDENPDLSIRVVSQDLWWRDREARIDVGLRYGTAPFVGRTILASLPESVTPVCAPAFAEKLGLRDGEVLDLDAVTTLPLIDCDNNEANWLNWPEWLDRLGRSDLIAKPKLRFSSYSDAVYASINGEGVVLGWTCLLQRPLADHRLVPICKASIQPSEEHHLLVADDSRDRQSIIDFGEWLNRALAA